MINTRAQVIKSRLDQLGEYSDLDDGLCREFGSEASCKANQLVVQWMKEAGLDARVDNMGNVRGERKNGKSRTFLMGSHLDTVTNAGKFDGPLGVILAIDQAAHIDHTLFPHNFEAVGFANEEGLRYPHCCLGSHLLSGSFKQDWLSTTDRHGIKLADAITHMGGDPARILNDSLTRDQVAGYLEVHMEQGPVLQDLGCPVGAVTGIVGQQRYLVTVSGSIGHAGTVPMKNRRDALCAAAEALLAIERLALTSEELVATVGRLQVVQGAINVIPGEVNFSLDIRHPDLEQLKVHLQELSGLLSEIEHKRKVSIDLKNVFEEKPVTCNQELTSHLLESIESSGYQMVELPSGAGHDASVLSAIAPVSMLFVRCKDGISHSPKEEVALDDIAAAIKVCDRFFKNL